MLSLPPLDIRPSRDPRFPAGPTMLPHLFRSGPLRHNAAETMLYNARHFGDLVHTRVFGRHIFQLNHPSLVQSTFLADSPHHHRNIVMQRARTVLGHGLLTSEEPLHMRQRRLAQPAFSRDRIAGYGLVIGTAAEHLTSTWRPGSTRDLHADMLELALRIVGKCLFDLDQLDNIAEIASAVDAFMGFVPLAFVPFSHLVERSPIPAMRRLRQGKLFLDTFIDRMIADRRQHPDDRGDLLSMLLSTTDTEDGTTARMTDQQIHDECVTILLAGHETTANALSFALHLLATHPAEQQLLADEARSVLGSGDDARTPTAADYPRLPYSTQVFAEAMRLFPPVWVTARTAVEPYTLAGYTIPAGSAILAPQFAIHRDPRLFPDPDRFDPTRFTPANKADLPKYAYFPFAGGSRQCIAEGLAWMEGTLTLAAIARDWQLSLPPGAPAQLKLQPAVSLRPARGVPVHLTRR